MYLCPFRACTYTRTKPRALPWAMDCRAFSPSTTDLRLRPSTTTNPGRCSGDTAPPTDALKGQKYIAQGNALGTIKRAESLKKAKRPGNFLASLYKNSIFAANINVVMTGSEDKEKEKTRRENLSRFIYQLANTCFTAMVVVAAVGLVLGVDDAKPYALLLGVGIFSTIFLALFADNILKRK